MLWSILKVFIAGTVISLTSTLAGRLPALAGFILALPISSMIALALAQVEHQDVSRTAAFARSILFSVPLSLLFFVPFLFAERLRAPFWVLYGSGLLLLGVGYLLHQRWSS